MKLFMARGDVEFALLEERRKFSDPNTFVDYLVLQGAFPDLALHRNPFVGDPLCSHEDGTSRVANSLICNIEFMFAHRSLLHINLTYLS
jgi:hypothetical protein